jgi:hypothetical protein
MANAKYKLKGNNKIPNYDSELEIDVDDKYEAYSKDIPEPTPHGEKNQYITWFNAFGIREKATGQNADVPYTVSLQSLPEGKKLFVWYDGKAHEIKLEKGESGKEHFPLNIGDPPTGQFP